MHATYFLSDVSDTHADHGHDYAFVALKGFGGYLSLQARSADECDMLVAAAVALRTEFALIVEAKVTAAFNTITARCAAERIDAQTMGEILDQAEQAIRDGNDPVAAIRIAFEDHAPVADDIDEIIAAHRDEQADRRYHEQRDEAVR